MINLGTQNLSNNRLFKLKNSKFIKAKLNKNFHEKKRILTIFLAFHRKVIKLITVLP